MDTGAHFGDLLNLRGRRPRTIKAARRPDQDWALVAHDLRTAITAEAPSQEVTGARAGRAVGRRDAADQTAT